MSKRRRNKGKKNNHVNQSSNIQNENLDKISADVESDSSNKSTVGTYDSNNVNTTEKMESSNLEDSSKVDIISEESCSKDLSLDETSSVTDIGTTSSDVDSKDELSESDSLIKSDVRNLDATTVLENKNEAGIVDNSEESELVSSEEISTDNKDESEIVDTLEDSNLASVGVNSTNSKVTPNTNIDKSLDDESESLISKLFYGFIDVACVLILMVICSIVGYLYAEVTRTSTLEASTAVVRGYINDTVSSAALKANEHVLEYYKNGISERDSIFISPICIQSSLYKLYDNLGIQDESLFESYENGVEDWDTSEQLLQDDNYYLINAGEMSTEYQLEQRVKNLSGGFIREIMRDMHFTDKTVFSVFSFKPVFNNAVHNKVTGTISIEDDVLYKETDTYKAVKLLCNDNIHSVYLIDGSFDDFTFGLIE